MLNFNKILLLVVTSVWYHIKVILSWVPRLLFYAFVLKLLSIFCDVYYYYSIDRLESFSLLNDIVFRYWYAIGLQYYNYYSNLYVLVLVGFVMRICFINDPRFKRPVRPKKKKKVKVRLNAAIAKAKRDPKKLEAWWITRKRFKKSKKKLVFKKKYKIKKLRKYLLTYKFKVYKNRVKKVKFYKSKLKD